MFRNYNQFSVFASIFFAICLCLKTFTNAKQTQTEIKHDYEERLSKLKLNITSKFN